MLLKKTLLWTILALWTLLLPAWAQDRHSSTTALPSVTTLLEVQAEIGPAEGGKGLEILSVLPPANRSQAYRSTDLKAGDQILALNGQPVRTVDDFRDRYEALSAGQNLEIGVQRGQRRWIERFPKADPATLPRVHRVRIEGNPEDLAMLMGLGVIFSLQEEQLRVVTLFPGGAGSDLFEEGDRLLSLNGEEIEKPARLQQLWQEAPIGQDLEFRLDRNGKTIEFTVPKPEAPAGGRRIVRQ